MRFGLSIPNFAEPHRLVAVAQAAERAGWDGFFLWDHILIDRDAPVPISEPWTVLAAIAGVTNRVRLGTLVTPVARRRPWVLARQVTTVDHLSGGRAVLGVGLGVPPETEYAPFGESADPRRHAELLDEGLEVIAGFWSGVRVDHDGPHHHVDGVQLLPVPMQQPRVPIWSAAALPARAGVRRAARWDGVVPLYTDGAEFRPVTPDEVVSIIDEATALGARPGSWDVAVWTLADDDEQRHDYSAAGATWLIEGPAPGEGWLEDAKSLAEAGPART
jgi:alkanesulfonate monooxygenase SsuD/methylene tetrahydromethanopterin reductase-like flavin-dependent oxidoreductase (luciferase family)